MAPRNHSSSGGGSHQSHQHPHGGGLAGSVGPEEAVYLALVDVQVEVVDREDAVAVALGETVGLDCEFDQ